MFIMQNIRPQNIENALITLKDVMKNPLYQDVTMNDNWRQDCEATDRSLWQNLTGENDEHLVESDPEDKDKPEEEEEVEDDRSRLSGIPFDSCIQPKYITSDSNVILNLAPGEGKRPRSFYEDEHSDELSFPQLLPSGKFGYSMARSKKLSMKKYFQARVTPGLPAV